MLELNFSPFPEIKTERLLLRRQTIKDAEEIFYLRSDAAVMKYIDRPKATSIEDAYNFLNISVSALNANEAISWAITLKDFPEKLIGYIGFWRIKKEHYRAEIGYSLGSAYWRKGIMKEAITPVIAYGFNVMNLHSVEADINSENRSSAALLEASGFIKEAHFKEDFFFDGVFRDTIIYSKLR